MSRSYIPEYAYGAIHDDNGRWTGKYGLVPWPAHLRPQETPDIELTKKGEAYVAAALAEADGVFFLTLDRNDRTSVATTIERLIDMLDALDGDENLEPSLGAPENHPGGYKDSDADGWKAKNADDREEACEDEGAQCEDEGAVTGDNEPTLGAPEGTVRDQARWGNTAYGLDEVEDENEHGGDINDEPHDPGDCGDSEPNLGRLETMHQGIGSYSGLSDDETGLLAGNLAFEGEGYSIGNQMLDAAGADRVRVSPGLPRGKWTEIAHKLPDGTVMRACQAPNDNGIPELKATDFDKLPWA
jgi:hypothetical protein